MPRRAVMLMLLLHALFARAGGGPHNWLVVYEPDDPHAVAIARAYQAERRIPEGHLVPYSFPKSRVLSRGVIGDRYMRSGEAYAMIEHLRAVMQSQGVTGQIHGIALAGLAPTVYQSGTDNNLYSLCAALFHAPDATGTNDLDARVSTRSLVFRGPEDGSSGALMDTTEIRSDLRFGGRRHWMASHIGYTGAKGLRSEEALSMVTRSAAADATFPMGTVYWPLNSDVRSTTRENQIAITTPEWDALGISYWIEGRGYGGNSNNVRQLFNRVGGLDSFPRTNRVVQGQIVGWSTLNIETARCLYAPGALAEHLTSFGGVVGRLFDVSQTAFTEWLRWGAAGSSGTVSEPLALWRKFPHARLHSHYFRGATLAEAFIQAVHTPVQLMIAGDPLLQPYARPPVVSIATPADGEIVSGIVSIACSVTGSLAVATNVDLAVNGRIVRVGQPGEFISASRTVAGFDLDTVTMPNGFHEIRVIARNDDAIRSQGFAAREIVVSNGPGRLELIMPSSADFRGQVTATATPVSLPGITSIHLRAVGQTLATFGPSGGTTNFHGRRLSYDRPTRVFAVARSPAGEVWSMPATVSVVWSNLPPTSNAPASHGAIALARVFTNAPSGFAWTSPPAAIAPVDDRLIMSFASLSNFPHLTAASVNRAGIEFVSWFEAKDSGLHDFACQGGGVEVSLLIDGNEVISPVVPGIIEPVYGVERLDAGRHEMRWRVRITGSNARFEAAYRTPRTFFFDRYDFAPISSAVCFADAGTATTVPPLLGRADSTNQVTLRWADTLAGETNWRAERFTGDAGAALVGYMGTNAPPSLEAPFSTNSLQAGARVANDTNDVWTRVPEYLTYGARLLTADADRGGYAASSNLYQVSVSSGTIIYAVFHPNSPASGPTWLAAQGGWTALTDKADSAAIPGWDIYRRAPALSNGVVNLGQGGVTFGGSVSFVFVREPAWTGVGEAGANATSLVVTGLAPTQHRFRVIALFTNGVYQRSRTALADCASPASNAAPNVDAGPDRSVILPAPAALRGVVLDDGDSPSVAWSVVSGPGSVSFSATNAVESTATFSLPGVYIVELTASDGIGSSTDQVVVTALPGAAGNAAPLVHAGPDQSIHLAQSALLTGSATDDGRPDPPGALSVRWRQTAGPALAMIQNAASATTRVGFASTGLYVFALTADDGGVVATDTVEVAVGPDPNAAPLVNAGDASYAYVSFPTTLVGSATDDGLPAPPGALTVRWFRVSGPGNVAFSNPTSAVTDALFTNMGVYELELRGDDGARWAGARRTLKVIYFAATNAAPTVDLGPDRESIYLDTVEIPILVSDDGLPNPPARLFYTWTGITGAGEVRAETTGGVARVRVTAPGTYTLRLEVGDGNTNASDQLVLQAPELATRRIAWYWGRNHASAATPVGIPGTLDATNLLLLPEPVARNVRKALGASTGGILLDRFGQVLTQGRNTYWQRGDTNPATRLAFVQLAGLSNIIDIGQGDTFRLAVDRSGRVFSWGRNHAGQLGLGFITNANTAIPTMIPGLDGVCGVGCGVDFSIALLTNGSVRTWGESQYFRLGNGNATNDMPTPVDIGLTGVVAIAAGDFHGLALLADGTLRAWGRNNSGQIGNGTNGATVYASNPVPVRTVTGGPLFSNVIAIAAGYEHSIALRSDGTVWTWGRGGSGELGRGNLLNTNLPTQVPGLATDMIAIAASDYVTFALDRSGRVWACGSNADQLLGVDARLLATRSTMGAIQGIPPIARLFAANSSAFALTRGYAYEDFLAHHFTTFEQNDPLVSGPDADPDGDGWPNLAEYAQDMNPRAPDEPEWSLRQAGGELQLDLRRVAYADVIESVEKTSDIAAGSWLDTGYPSTLLRDDGDHETLRYAAPMTNAPGEAFRVRWTDDPLGKMP